MDDIELVIKMPKKDYITIKKAINSLIENGVERSSISQVCLAILDGTPLPKGHGRIADMDEAIKCIRDVEGEDAVWAISLIEWACSKRTIIEADKAESEEING